MRAPGPTIVVFWVCHDSANSDISEQHDDDTFDSSVTSSREEKSFLTRAAVLQAIMLVEGHMDDGFTFSRAQEEESRSARVIRKCQSLFNRFNKYVSFSVVYPSRGACLPAWRHLPPNVHLALVLNATADCPS